MPASAVPDHVWYLHRIRPDLHLCKGNRTYSGMEASLSSEGCVTTRIYCLPSRFRRICAFPHRRNGRTSGNVCQVRFFQMLHLLHGSCYSQTGYVLCRGGSSDRLHCDRSVCNLPDYLQVLLPLRRERIQMFLHCP